jgi:hypothetical protein
MANKAKRWYTEDDPENPKFNPVVELDETNWKDVIYNSDTDVMLDIYAPWC